ncbi:hypothetical protein [Maricaulis salignorans]|uniref:hypothetical protein n=1 Tax=Maricaulis salignorans TaxID=144026 RepID=UPI003A8E43C5
MSRSARVTATSQHTSSGGLPQAAWAGCLYFSAIFALGFGFGVLRTLALEAFPNLTRLGVVLVEIPVILALAWLICGALIARLSLTGGERSASVMGAFALALLLVAEAGLSVGLNGLSLQEHLALYRQPSHVIGLAGQCMFAIFPWLRVRFFSPPARHLQTKP